MTSALAKIHIGKKALGLDDDTYRAMLTRLTGAASAKGLTAQQMRRVLREMEAAGAFKGASKPAQSALEGRYAAKLQALWIAGWNLGVFRDKSDRAMLAFVQRQTGISHTRFLRYADDASSVIEALKSWIAREAGLFWGKAGQKPGELSARIAYRQWQILFEADVKSVKRGTVTYPLRNDFIKFSRPFFGNNFPPKQADWIALMNALGAEVRKNAEENR